MTEEHEENDLTKALKKAFATYPTEDTEDTETRAMPDTDTDTNADFHSIYNNALLALGDIPEALGESADGRIVARVSPEFVVIELAGLEQVSEVDQRGILEAVNGALASLLGGVFDKLGGLAPGEAK